MPTWTFRWSPQEGIMYDRFNCYIQDVASGNIQAVGTTEATSFELEQPNIPDPRVFMAAPVVGGIEANFDLWTTIQFQPNAIGNTEITEEITNFVVQQDGSMLRASWDPVLDPKVVRFEIRLKGGSAWEDSRAVFTVVGPANQVSFAYEATGSQTFYIRGFGSLEQMGPVAESPAVLVVRDNRLIQQGTVNEFVAGFTGTKTNCSVVGGNLGPTAFPPTSSITSDPATYPAPSWWPIADDAVYVTPYVDAVSAVSEVIEVKLGFTGLSFITDTSDWIMPIFPKETAGVPTRLGTQSIFTKVTPQGKHLDGHKMRIEIRVTADNPAASPTWSSWMVWVPGASYIFRAYQLRFTWQIVWPFYVPTISTLTHTRFRRNQKDEGEVTVSGTGGTSVTFTSGMFSVAPVPAVSAKYAGIGYYATYESVTKTGMTVRMFNGAGTEVMGTVGWNAAGV